MSGFSGKKVGEIRSLLYEFSGAISMLILNISGLNLSRCSDYHANDSGLLYSGLMRQKLPAADNGKMLRSRCDTQSACVYHVQFLNMALAGSRLPIKHEF